MRAVTGIERTFGDEELIVSKTDTAGRISYANDLFVRISGYSLKELLGKPHNLVRHPHMPRGVFKYLWERLAAREEVFAYVMNLTKRGDHYWVFAHVTPSYGNDGQVVGYHSNRRTANRAALTVIQKLYAQMNEEEARHQDRKVAAAASLELLHRHLLERQASYEQFVFELEALRSAA